MIKRAFLDTGAIYSLVDARDFDHELVKAVYNDPSFHFITHKLILVEAFSLITKRLNKKSAVKVMRNLRESPRITVVPMTDDLLEMSWLRCVKYEDKEWDWIDCCSFEVMREMRIMEALSLDRHFQQAGYKLLIPL